MSGNAGKKLMLFNRAGMTNLNIRRPLTAIEEEEDLQRAIELSRLAYSTPVTPVLKQNPDSLINLL